MHSFELKSGDLNSLTLAADARLGQTSYSDDQIWELCLEGGEPPALALQTTYGLRARNMRLFPRFSEGYTTVTNPAEFASPPVVNSLYPNFLDLTFSPLAGIKASLEYWVPQSNAVAGRVRLINQSESIRQLRFEWAALLLPAEGGERMAPLDMQGVAALGGKCDALVPLVFITGGAEAIASPYPALLFLLELQPGETRQFIWCHAGLDSPEASFDLARQIAASKWDAQRARLELTNAGLVEVFTGNPDWDTAFFRAQISALSLASGPSENLPSASFVATRRPDYGYSRRGDGSDYRPLWSGQTPLETWYLASLVLPAAPQLVKGWLLNFLVTQAEDGSIDWKPGLGGQRSNRLATPLLASLAWELYQAGESVVFLEQVFPGLIQYLHAWFNPAHDRDRDGVPEWDHAMQAGFEDHPLFSRWNAWSQGINITTAESPALCAMLVQECRVLTQIAALLGRQEPSSALQALSEKMQAAVEKAWSEDLLGYTYWDRDTHVSGPPVLLGERLDSGAIHVYQKFTEPVRLVLWIRSGDETTRRTQAFIHGSSPTGAHRVERLTGEQFLWFPGWGTATSERTYTQIEYIEIQGMAPDDLVTIHSAGYASLDISTLLPLWAKIPSVERARQLVTRTIKAARKFWRPYGLPACPSTRTRPDVEACHVVHLPWCHLIGEGLLKYGYRAEAAELVTRLMNAICQTLQKDSGFRQFYHAETGEGLGEPDALSGLAPLGLFLQTLGVRLVSSQRVDLEGHNPFPWPVTVKYRGVTVLRQSEKTIVTFPDGQSITVEDTAPQIVTQE
jgi:hypothetical protein